MLREDGNSFILQSVLALADAVGLRVSLLDVIAAGDDFYLDGSEISRISTPCIQVIYGAALEVEAAGGRFFLVNPSQVLCDALVDLGMGRFLTRWSSKEWA